MLSIEPQTNLEVSLSNFVSFLFHSFYVQKEASHSSPFGAGAKKDLNKASEIRH